MLRKADNSALWAVIASLVLFFVGGILTTIVPPMVDKTWSKPFDNADPAKGPTGHLRRLTEMELAGRRIYIREGCWYCHTQQIRTILADTKRYGWKGVDAPISTPDEFVYDHPHMFGTKRTGPDLGRVGGKYDTQWHRTHFRNPRDLVKGSVMPAFPWIVGDPREFTELVAYIQTLGRDKDWRPNKDYEK